VIVRPRLLQFGAPSVIAWVLIMGGAGFVAGFFGPVIFAPGANQGPLVGILISGPGGVLLGVVLFAISRLSNSSTKRQWQILVASSALLAVVTLYLILPAPELYGYLQDVTIQSCKRPIDVADDAIRHWNKQIAPRPGAARLGWQEDSREMLQDDDGVILTVTIIREKKVLEAQKPWNRGQVVAKEWQPVDMQKSYYARYAGSVCGNYGTGTHSVLFNDQYFYGYPRNLGWPPRKLVNFLDLQTLESVPDKYRDLAGD
jgi:hypothetical protein